MWTNCKSTQDSSCHFDLVSDFYFKNGSIAFGFRDAVYCILGQVLCLDSGRWLCPVGAIFWSCFFFFLSRPSAVVAKMGMMELHVQPLTLRSDTWTVRYVTLLCRFVCCYFIVLVSQLCWFISKLKPAGFGSGCQPFVS